MAFTFTEDMHEVTGLGGLYERACRTAVCAGAQWFAIHPEADPIIDGDLGSDELVHGVNDEGKSLVTAINETLVPMDDGQKVKLGEFLTNSMYYVVLHHVMWIGSFGWPWYVTKMKRGAERKDTQRVER